MTLTNGGSNGNLSWKNSQLHWYVSTSNPLVKKLRLLLDKCSCIKLPKATVHLERPWRKGTSKTGQLEYFVAKQFLYFKYIVAYNNLGLHIENDIVLKKESAVKVNYDLCNLWKMFLPNFISYFSPVLLCNNVKYFAYGEVITYLQD